MLLRILGRGSCEQQGLGVPCGTHERQGLLRGTHEQERLGVGQRHPVGQARPVRDDDHLLVVLHVLQHK